MSQQYDGYIQEHRENLLRAYDWFQENLSDVLRGTIDLRDDIENLHDESKFSDEEYDPYDAYFYGGDKSSKVQKEFQYAWLHHIHQNPHHWQHWVLMNDDPQEGVVALEMPYTRIVEMICDWWSFSWKSGDLREIFKWYDEHESTMVLAPRTYATVKSILNQMDEALP